MGVLIEEVLANASRSFLLPLRAQARRATRLAAYRFRCQGYAKQLPWCGSFVPHRKRLQVPFPLSCLSNAIKRTRPAGFLLAISFLVNQFAVGQHSGEPLFFSFHISVAGRVVTKGYGSRECRGLVLHWPQELEVRRRHTLREFIGRIAVVPVKLTWSVRCIAEAAQYQRWRRH